MTAKIVPSAQIKENQADIKFIKIQLKEHDDRLILLEERKYQEMLDKMDRMEIELGQLLIKYGKNNQNNQL